MKSNKLIFIMILLLMKYLQCGEWPPDYIEEPPTIIEKTQIEKTQIEKTQIDIKFIKKKASCSWHNEKEIYCKNDLNWNTSPGHCF